MTYVRQRRHGPTRFKDPHRYARLNDTQRSRRTEWSGAGYPKDDGFIPSFLAGHLKLTSTERYACRRPQTLGRRRSGSPTMHTHDPAPTTDDESPRNRPDPFVQTPRLCTKPLCTKHGPLCKVPLHIPQTPPHPGTPTDADFTRSDSYNRLKPRIPLPPRRGHRVLRKSLRNSLFAHCAKLCTLCKASRLERLARERREKRTRTHHTTPSATAGGVV